MTHNVQNILVKHGAVRFRLTADNRHVVLAFMPRIPSDRHDLVSLGRLHQIIIISQTPLAVLSILITRQDAYAVICTKFTDNHRYTLIDKIRFHLAELVIHAVARTRVAHSTRPCVVTAVMHDIFARREVFCTPIILRIDLSTPIDNVVQQRVGIRVVIMHFDHQAVRNHIFRELAHRHHFATAVHTRRWPLNHERTASVVATRCTHGVHKRLVVRHQNFGFMLVIVVRCRGLVSACEKQVFVIVLEAVCNLRPEILLAGIHLVLFLVIQVPFEPAIIPVDVQNRHEASAHAHVHDRLHGIHPARRNFVRASARNNISPAGITRQSV